ncbi:histidinol dehydrogenase [Immundisolibacter cernigliae]|uniref:Histidinol dehydrogenase n=1 Tax=Immundisolibacter cernigliae TaxID=1810504 RepID=A0A1B1YS77_9GAMM|nr:histidinol dehydrogenase [Immundisolibacter cernigliae]ANX03503.1 histidinol dehydrogenase [Immundisolibacter cernigliae]
MRRLDSRAAGFEAAFANLLAAGAPDDLEVQAPVQAILSAVREHGDEALLDCTRRFDGWIPAGADDLEIPRTRLDAAVAAITPAQRSALQAAAGRVRAYHQRQRQESWQYTEADGSVLGQRVTPLDRVGVYVPGGKAAYPSSVLMNVIPAKVAGVAEIIMVSPTPGGIENPLVLAAAGIAGADRVFRIGGAQAVAALAYGTATVPAVDKIVGPGNRYVAAAKRQVFGTVGIDMIAGPSEVVIVADGSAPADWLAYDLFAQAEHDEQARSILLCPDAAYLDRVAERMAALLPGLERHAIVEAALRQHGALILTRDLVEAATLASDLAPEHLELAVADPQALLPHIRHAGAIFLGAYSPEAIGDYCAGPNHVLPTARTARFSSPLGVYDFQKRSSLIGLSAAGAAALAPLAAQLARGEGLSAHARSAECRLEQS